MSTLVYINSRNGIAKNAYEAITYAKKLGEEVIAITTGSADDSTLATAGEYGASKILVDRSIATDDAQQLTKVIANAVESTGANTVVFSNEIVAKSVAPRLSVRLKAGLISGAIAIPEGDTVQVNVFSGKAFGNVKINSDKKIISLLPNSIQPEQTGSACSVEDFNGNAGEAKIKLLETKKPEG
ncbi:MAG TPA: electron transfer flavoprotein subunit alpha/FixB family protein, partial [Crocinitomicaceae bacterium]|nr:electron transfer flavoprotein subunit alpha/FixB family protein [Crocinitomicaceae bacterium]